MRPQRSKTTHGAHTSPSSERKIYRAATQRREIHSEEASRAIGRKGAQRRIRPLHQVRRSPIVKSVHCHIVLYAAMGECDRKPRLVVGGKLNLHGNAAHRANVTVP